MLMLSNDGLWDARPFLLGDRVLMDVDIVTISVQAVVEHKRSVHERARIDKTTSLMNYHLLNVEYEATVEDLESDGTLSSEDDDFLISDLISKTHISRNPLGLID
jgi:hypothetical protein